MTTPIELRVAAPADAEALALIGAATFLETFAGIIDGAHILGHCRQQHALAVYQGWLTDPRVRIWLAVANPGDAPVGYLVLAPAQLPVADPRADDLEIKRVYLLHRFHGSGIGRRLLDAATTSAREQGSGRLLLGVYSRNDAAIAFYERSGFTRVGTRRFNVGGQEYDDLVMAREL